MLHLGPGASRKRVPPSPDVPSGNTLGSITRRSHKSPTACSPRASTIPGSLSLASSGRLTPHGQAGGGSRPPGSAPLHRRPPRRPPPATKMLRAPACGIMFVPHIMPPAPQESRRDAPGIALRKRLTCRRAAVARAATSGRYGVKRCPRHSRRFRAPIVACAAWSFLRERLTPRPAVAKSTYRFCVRKIRYSPALQNIGNHRAGESPPILGCRAKSAGQAWFRPSSVSGIGSRLQSAIRIQPQPSPALGRSGAGYRKIAHPRTARPHPRSKDGSGLPLGVLLFKKSALSPAVSP